MTEKVDKFAEQEWDSSEEN